MLLLKAQVNRDCHIGNPYFHNLVKYKYCSFIYIKKAHCKTSLIIILLRL